MSGGFQGRTPPPGYTPPPPQVIQMLRQAFGLHQQGQLAQAETLYREALTIQPDNPDALHFLGVLESQRGRREAGLSLIDRAVKVNPRNTAAFYNKYKDIQVLLIRGASVVIDNAAEATIYGLEVDFEAQPTDALFLRGSLGLMENEFDEWSDDTGDFTDRKLRNSPEMTANFLAAYTADLGGNGSLRPWAEVQYQDEMFLDGLALAASACAPRCDRPLVEPKGHHNRLHRTAMGKQREDQRHKH